MNDFILSFSDLHKETLEFNQKLEDDPDEKNVKGAINNYNSKIVLSLNTFQKLTKTKNPDLKKIANDIKKLLSDVVKNNYALMASLNQPNIDVEEKCKSTIQKNGFALMFLRDMSFGISMSLVEERPKDADQNLQFNKLKVNESNQIKKQLIDSFGQSVAKYDKTKKFSGVTPFEDAASIIYSFLNMVWQYAK